MTHKQSFHVKVVVTSDTSSRNKFKINTVSALQALCNNTLYKLTLTLKHKYSQLKCQYRKPCLGEPPATHISQCHESQPNRAEVAAFRCRHGKRDKGRNPTCRLCDACSAVGQRRNYSEMHRNIKRQYRTTCNTHISIWSVRKAQCEAPFKLRFINPLTYELTSRFPERWYASEVIGNKFWVYLSTTSNEKNIFKNLKIMIHKRKHSLDNGKSLVENKWNETTTCKYTMYMYTEKSTSNWQLGQSNVAKT